jgi:sensor histidine kinase YesM
MKNRTLIRVIHISFWLIYLAIHTWVFTNFLPFNTSLLRGIINGIPLMLLAYGNIWAISAFFEKRKYFQFVLIATLLLLIITLLRYYANELFPDFKANFGFVNKEDSLIIGIVLTNILILVFSSFYQILVNRFIKTKKQSEEIQVHQSAQLQYLRSQINPHFLFNTLNNIYALALAKSDKTPDMVLKLSDLLRYVIYQDDNKKVLLKNEIKLIKNYIDLFILKSEERPNIQFYITGTIENHEIEPMILIPIVENCFKHCDLDINENAYIKINLKVEKDYLFFEAINTKNESIKQKDLVGGVGLNNIKKRLELVMLPENYSCKIDNKKELYQVNLQLKL